MNWLNEVAQGRSAESAVLVFGVTAGLGLALGAIRIRGVGLGIAGVLFSGLLLGHMGFGAASDTLMFARDFGLILFVYTVGLQVGPGFFAALRREGLALNAMAALVVFLGAAFTLLIAFLGDIELPAAVGMFSGATTNTPSLAAAQAALEGMPSYTEEAGKLPAMGYAASYPFGIVGLILVMVLIRGVFRVDIGKEEETLKRIRCQEARPVERFRIRVENRALDGVRVEEVAALHHKGVLFAKILREGLAASVDDGTELRVGDVLMVVGRRDGLHALEQALGASGELDVHEGPDGIATRSLIVTRKAVLGKTAEELALDIANGVHVMSVQRSGIELAPTLDVKLQYGDVLSVIGEDRNIDAAAARVGNSAKQLSNPEVIPLFVGIVLGLALGSCPIAMPGMPAPVKLGVAGGPLVVAIVLSRIGHVGPLVWYMPASANLMLREIGIVLFLASVGLRSGDRFVETLVDGDGLYWMGLATVITLVPLLLVACFARSMFKMNYLHLCGLLSGSMTDPPALAFAVSSTGSDTPTVAYATVYPLTMILRVLVAQAMVLLLMR